MSKSFPHQPCWTLLHDEDLRRERHDHRFQDCDLPDVAEFIAGLKANGAPQSVCRYVPADAAVAKSCGCHLCTGHYLRRHERRRSRHESKTELHQLDLSDEYQP